MKPKVKKELTKNAVLFRVCISVVIVILGVVGFFVLQYAYGQKLYDDTSIQVKAPATVVDEEDSSSETAKQEPKPQEKPAEVKKKLSNLSLEPVRKESKNVRYWIYIPGTRINYPVMQAQDNSFYLHHSYKGKWLFSGSIFMDCSNKYDFSDFNTIIYGHHMNDGSMFAGLIKFMNRSFVQRHPYIYLTKDGQSTVFRIFAASEVPTNSFVYNTDLTTDGEKETFIKEALAGSKFDLGVKPTKDDHLLTLSTCTNFQERDRWVVQAVKVSV